MARIFVGLISRQSLGTPMLLARRSFSSVARSTSTFDFFYGDHITRSFHVAAECPRLTATAKSFAPGLHPRDRGRCQDVFWSVVADANLPSARSGSRQETNNDGIVNHIR